MLLGQATNEVTTNWTVLAPVVLGFLAVWYLLPSPRRRSLVYGALGGAAALLGFAAFLFHGFGESLDFDAESFLFFAFALQAFIFGILMIVQRNPARSALFFAVVVLNVCGLFLLLAAPFLMGATIIIYAGAIIVTFLFVIMLSQATGWSDANDRSREPSLAAAVGFMMLGTLLVVLQRAYAFPEAKSAADMISEIDRYSASEEPAEELLMPAEHYSKADFDDRMRKPTRAEVFLVEAQRLRSQLGYEHAAIPAHHREEKRNAEPIDDLRNLLNLGEGILPLPSAEELRKNWLEQNAATRAESTQLLKDELARIRYEIAYLAAVRRGLIRPGADKVTLSPYGQSRPVGHQSDPAKVEPARLPAANIAAIGRVLFTDHLLAIELGGTLLLVATIGAIAIAGGRPEKAV